MPGLLDSFKKHAQEVYGTLSDNERIKDRAKYGDLVKQGFLQSFPMLDKQPQDVTMDDLLASGIGAMPLTFGGRMAAHAPIDDINKAVKEAEERGLFGFKVGSDDWMKANKEIHKKTGIHFGADNMPRFEMDDSVASLHGLDKTRKGTPIKKQMGDLTWRQDRSSVPFDELVTHQELKYQYPDVSNVEYGTAVPKDIGGTFRPNIGEGYIGLNPELSIADANSTNLHELQHYLQIKENFAGGGSPDVLSKFKDPNEAYRKIAGEAEARAVQQRIPLNRAQRAASFPLESYDVPIEGLIVRFGGKKK